MRIIIIMAGLMKIYFSLIIFIGSLLAILTPGIISSTFQILLVVAGSIVMGFYLYYTLRTAFWNLLNKSYRTNLPLVIGVLIHLILVVYAAVDFTRFYRASSVMLVMPFILIGFVIGVYDVQKLFKGWDYNHPSAQKGDGFLPTEDAVDT